MDEQWITDLRNYVLTQEPIFKNADSEYYHFINVYVFVNSSLIRKDALKKGQEQWSNIKRKNSDKTSVYKILETTYTAGYDKMIKQLKRAKQPPVAAAKPKKIQKKVNDFFTKKTVSFDIR